MSDNNINATDATGKTALMTAVWEGDLPKVKKLLADGADMSITGQSGENVLHYAVRQHNLDVLDTILDTGIDIDIKEIGGYESAAIHNAASVGNIPILERLLQRGANPNVQDRYKMTALQWAAQQGQTDAVKVLLASMAEVNTKNDKGVTPLISAVIKGIPESVEMLTGAGADINAVAQNGYSALMYAAYYGHVDIVAYLLANGADKSIVGKKGETALSIAEKKKFDAVAALLA